MDRPPRPRRGAPAAAAGPAARAPVALHRAGPLRGLVAVLADLGVDPAALLGEFGLAPSFFDDPEHLLPVVVVDRLFGRAVAATGCEHVGLLVGARAGLSTLGVLGYLLQSAPDLGTALRLLRQHMQVNNTHLSAAIDVRGDSVEMTLGLVEGGLAHGDQLLAGGIAIAFGMLRGLCGPTWRPTELHLSFAAPADAAPYRAYFGLRPRFGAARTMLAYPARWLAQPLPGADPLLHAYMTARLRELRTGAPGDVAGAVRRLLASMVTGADCSLDAVASRLGLRTHTLKRRLAAEGATFRGLRDEVRHELARQLLRHARAPVGDVALTLGYSEPSALSRAFRRRAGAAPRAWRRDALASARASDRGPGAGSRDANPPPSNGDLGRGDAPASPASAPSPRRRAARPAGR